MFRDRKAVSPVIGVILMVAAAIVIAAIVMGFLGGINPPKKPLDIQLANGELVVDSSGNWTLTFLIAGSDAKALNEKDLDITLFDYNGTGNIPYHVTIKGSLLEITGSSSKSITIYPTPTPTSNNTTPTPTPTIKTVAALYPGDRVRVTIKYKPTGQILFDNIIIAREE